jgi:hypothetical protein
MSIVPANDCERHNEARKKLTAMLMRIRSGNEVRIHH